MKTTRKGEDFSFDNISGSRTTLFEFTTDWSAGSKFSRSLGLGILCLTCFVGRDLGFELLDLVSDPILKPQDPF